MVYRSLEIINGGKENMPISVKNVDRFIDEEELSYAELYLSYNEEDI